MSGSYKFSHLVRRHLLSANFSSIIQRKLNFFRQPWTLIISADKSLNTFVFLKKSVLDINSSTLFCFFNFCFYLWYVMFPVSLQYHFYCICNRLCIQSSYFNLILFNKVFKAIIYISVQLWFTFEILLFSLFLFFFQRFYFVCERERASEQEQGVEQREKEKQTLR